MKVDAKFSAPVEPILESVTITFTAEEAKLLKMLVSSIGGTGSTAPSGISMPLYISKFKGDDEVRNKVTDRLYGQLGALGI